jgi:ubiquinone/menaquinone biosynthesis C-methylase UbiE
VRPTWTIAEPRVSFCYFGLAVALGNLPRRHTSMALYDQIGHGYSRTRRADARIVERIAALLALPAASHIADVGAGSGNYSNALAEAGYGVVAIEPSATMRSQAAAHPSVIWRDGFAEALPLRDGEVNAAICILAFHHIWDHRQALREMRRATAGGPLLLLTFEPRTVPDFWLDDYFPEISLGDKTLFPPIEEVAAMIREETGLGAAIEPFPVPSDLTDWFLAAGWARPHLYLDPQVRAGISAFAVADQSAIARGLDRLHADLGSGAWFRRYGQVLTRQCYDAGYRFLVAR